MTEAKHTSGPYRAEGPDEFGDYNILHDGDALAVAAVVSNMRPADEVAANASLFGAAPELLECARNGWRMCNALIIAAEQVGKPLPEDHYAVRDLPKFEAAIAKAEGRS